MLQACNILPGHCYTHALNTGDAAFAKQQHRKPYAAELFVLTCKLTEHRSIQLKNARIKRLC